MNRLIVLSGVPGSGKSYFSASFKAKKEKHVYIISSDALRKNNQSIHIFRQRKSEFVGNPLFSL